MSVAIGLGLMDFPFAGAGDYWRWVDLCEAGGVDSLWQTDRLVSRQPILECMAVMAALAGRTRRLRFGMNVVSLALRDPVLLAKQCATIDVLSEGRLLPAFGIGSPLGPEWQALDIDTKTRGRRTDESAGDHRPAVARGERRFRRQALSPEGRRRSRPSRCSPTCRCGSAARRTPRSAAPRRYGTGWQAGGETPADVGTVVAAIKKALPEAGRTIDEDHYGAAFPSISARPSDAACRRAMAAYAKRTGRDPARLLRRSATQRRHPRPRRRIRGGRRREVHPASGRPRGDAVHAPRRRKLIEKVLPHRSRSASGRKGRRLTARSSSLGAQDEEV